MSTASVLRFITAGSVDDGKSTLIGRLLFDSKGIFQDQLAALARSKHQRLRSPVGGLADGGGDEVNIDLSLLTDGLEAEREQGITIDVAYRYFATPQRKFIIADTPGHEQYTRNMVTGASTADAMILLIDAVKVGNEDQLLIQSKRHSAIAHLLQIKHVIVSVNKMDLVNFDQSVFDSIMKRYREFASQLGLQDVHAIPLSALLGDNVVGASKQMSWYRGPTLIQLLESLSVEDDQAKAQALRFPVQWVARHDGHKENNFRAYAGRIEAGTLRRGDQLLVQPSGQIATLKDILTFAGGASSQSHASAIAGQSVSLILNESLDISRGDMLTSRNHPATILKNFVADVCWLSEEPLDMRRKYWLKHTTKQSFARVTGIQSLLDLNTQKQNPVNASSALSPSESLPSLKLNDIARISISVQDALATDAYQAIRATGAFILIDELTHQTSAAGMIGLDR